VALQRTRSNGSYPAHGSPPPPPSAQPASHAQLHTAPHDSTPCTHSSPPPPRGDGDGHAPPAGSHDGVALGGGGGGGDRDAAPLGARVGDADGGSGAHSRALALNHGRRPPCAAKQSTAAHASWYATTASCSSALHGGAGSAMRRAVGLAVRATAVPRRHCSRWHPRAHRDVYADRDVRVLGGAASHKKEAGTVHKKAGTVVLRLQVATVTVTALTRTRTR
jgi:hypothetical protein